MIARDRHMVRPAGELRSGEGSRLAAALATLFVGALLVNMGLTAIPKEVFEVMAHTKSTTEPARDGGDHELVITRVFDAPVELVWKAWTDPEHVARWWGPRDFTSPKCTIDFRVGGRYHFAMQSPDGQIFWSTGTYREIEPHAFIACTDSFADEEGNVVPATHYGMGDDFPLEMEVVLTFEAIANGKTRFTLRHSGLPSGPMEDMTRAGWNQSFDKLAASLA